MPTGNRIRANNVIGRITDDPLGSASTSFNSPLLNLLPAVVGGHAVVTFDPLRQYGNPEIAIITSHTASSTVATIERGAYGSTARSHPVDTVWIHAPVDEDLIKISSSTDRPTDPYEGQLIYEVDTNTYQAWHGSAWSEIGAGAVAGVHWTGHTFTIAGEVVVASGDTDFVCPLFIPVSAGKTVKLVKARYRINAGTSATVKLQKNAVDITGYTGLSVTTTSTTTDATDVALADNDLIALIVTAVVGTPKNLSFTIVLEHG